MGILEIHRDGLAQAFQRDLERQKVETARLSAECQRIGAEARKFDRTCIELDDSFRPTPEQWHSQCMRDAYFWLIVVAVPLLLAGVLRRRLRWSWLWALTAFVLSAYAVTLGVGYASYYYFPVERLLSDSLLPKGLVAATTTFVSLALFLIGLASQPHLAHLASSMSMGGPLHRIRLLACILSTFAALGAGLLALVDGSWTAYLAWATNAYGAHKPSESTIPLLLWSGGVLLAALVLPPLWRPTIGRISRWIRSGA